ncbi:hypothetical protein [Streptomyces sp. NPDC005799]|uniref:hypothetical protein n=1 Tax=Streptomyces sp. NPDC005799 TaxID=3154678 RepID=UPI0033ED8285
MTRLQKKLSAAVGLGIAAATSLVTLAATPASASSEYGCDWPKVCFYLTSSDWLHDSPTAAYQDITSYYQTLGSQSRGSHAVFNSRNDDRAMLRYTYRGTTHYFCLNPNSDIEFDSDATVTGIKIQDASSC